MNRGLQSGRPPVFSPTGGRAPYPVDRADNFKAPACQHCEVPTMQTAKPYTFTYPALHGPAVERFESLNDLACFLSGWCRAEAAPILTVSIFDWRGGR